MRLKITTRVDQNYLDVKAGFTQNLFLSLNPPFPPVKLIRFDGCKKNDIVILELNFIFFKQRWESDITFDNTDENAFEFIDQGKTLPFFLSRWHHHHVVRKVDELHSEIIDEINFSTSYWITDILMFPALYLQFLYRKPIYKKVFGKK